MVINEYFDELEKLFPTFEELEAFEESLDRLDPFLRKRPIDPIVEVLKDFESQNVCNDFSELKKEAHLMENLRAKNEELQHKISECDSENEEMLKHKTDLQEKMKEFTNDRDIVLTYKLSTLSHLCFSPKVKFGFLLDQDNLDRYKTFSYNSESNLPEEIECRWKILRSFVNPENNTSSSD